MKYVFIGMGLITAVMLCGTWAVKAFQSQMEPCYRLNGTVVTSHFVNETFNKRWNATTGRVELDDGRIVPFYSRPDNIYEVGDRITSTFNCGMLNQEIGRKHD